MSRPAPSRIGSAIATEMDIRLVPNLAMLWDEILLLCASSEDLARKNLLKFIPVKKIVLDIQALAILKIAVLEQGVDGGIFH